MTSDEITLWAQRLVESGWDSRIDPDSPEGRAQFWKTKRRSKDGAEGVAQFLRGTAKDMGLDDPFDPVASMAAQEKYMKWIAGYLEPKIRHLNLSPEVKRDMALAGYNWGVGNMTNPEKIDLGSEDWVSQLPGETRNYLKRIKGFMEGAPPPSSGGFQAPSLQRDWVYAGKNPLTAFRLGFPSEAFADSPEAEKVDSLNADILKILKMDSPAPVGANATVVRVDDGDSYRLRLDKDGSEKRVRLSGLNAAEKGAHPDKKPEEARARAQAMLPEGSRVTWERRGPDDTYGRGLGRIINSGGKDVGKTLKGEGLVGDYDDKDFRQDEESFMGTGTSIAINLAGIPAMLGGMAAGAKVGAGAGLLAGPLAPWTSPIGAAIGGLAGLTIPAMAFGAAGREGSAAVDRWLYDSDRKATHSGFDVLLDAGLAVPFSGLGRVVIGSYSMGKALAGISDKSLSVWKPEGVYGRLKEIAMEAREGGYLGQLELAEEAVAKAQKSVAAKGKNLAEDAPERVELGRLEEELRLLKKGGEGVSPFFGGTDDEGIGLLRDIVDGSKAQSHWFRTPYRMLMNSKNPAAQQAGQMIFIANHLDNVVRSLDARYGEGIARETKKKVAEITAAAGKKAGKAAKKRISELITKEGHEQFGRSLDDIDPLLQGHKKVHERTMAEAFKLKELANVMQSAMHGGGYVPLQAQKDFVHSTLKPEIKQGVAGILEKAPEGQMRDQLAAYLSRSGVKEGQASRAAQMFMDERTSARGIHQYSRLRDKETGEALLPEAVFEQDLLTLTGSMFEKDAILSTNSLLFGQKKKWYTLKDKAGKPTQKGFGSLRRYGWEHGPGLDTMEGDTLLLPLVPRKILENLRKTDLKEYKVAHEFFRERYAPTATSTTAHLSKIKKFTANALLTKNWALQLSEVAKATAYAANGVQSVELGAKVARQTKKARWAEATGAVQSSIDDTIGREITRDMARGGRQWHPAILARTADKTSRQFAAYSALGTTQQVAETAAKEMRILGRFSGATKQQAMEILQDQGTARALDGEAAANTLREAWEAAAGRANQYWDESGKVFRTREGFNPELPTLEDGILERGVRNLVGRWHYMTGAGMIAPIMRKPSVAIAMQFRSFMVQASSQYKNDVLLPMWRGAREGDASLFYLGLGRAGRSMGHQWVAATPAVLVRDLQALRTEDDLEAYAQRLFSKVATESVGGVGGIAASTMLEAGKLVGTGETRGWRNTTSLLPAVSALSTAVEGGLKGAHELGSGDFAKGLTGIARASRPVIGGIFPQAGMALEGPLNLANEAAKNAAKKKKAPAVRLTTW